MALPRVHRRWAAPVVVFAAVAAVAAVPNLIPSAGASTPDLPALTAAQLLAKAQGAGVTSFSGDVRLTSDLGLPDLGGLTGGASSTLTSLASGTHDAHVWYDGPDRVRIALPSSLAETDWIRNGTDVWSWDSTTQEAVHGTVSPNAAATAVVPDPAEETPNEVAQRLLDAVTPSTEVTVRAPRYVADRAVYELALAPKSPASTVSEAVLSIDAATGLPLDVRVIPRSATTAAFEFGFTKIDSTRPSASEFNFTPPGSATVTNAGDLSAMVLGKPEHSMRGAHLRKNHSKAGQAAEPVPAPVAVRPPAKPRVVGSDWDAVVIVDGQAPGRFGDILSAAQHVGTGSSAGRLVTTKLVNILVLDDGRIAVGAVTPTALEAAAATS